MSLPDLFEPAREAKRDRLRALGWWKSNRQGIGLSWLAPTGESLTEEEAFAWLARHEAAEAKAREELG